MHATPCSSLDDFLARDLPSPEAAAFSAHLQACDACRQGVAEHGRLSGLLTRAVSRLEPLPAGFQERLQERRRGTIRARWVRSAVAAAVAGISIVGWIWLRPPPTTPPTDPVVADASPATSRQALVTFEQSPDVIAVPLESTRRNITLIWVYPVSGQSSLGTPPASPAAIYEETEEP